MKELYFQPIAGKAEEIIDAILRIKEVASCTKELYAIHLVCEELVVNVVSYAYSDGAEGYLKVQIEKEEGWMHHVALYRRRRCVQSVRKRDAGCFPSVGRTSDWRAWNIPYRSDDG